MRALVGQLLATILFISSWSPAWAVSNPKSSSLSLGEIREAIRNRLVALRDLQETSSLTDAQKSQIEIFINRSGKSNQAEAPQGAGKAIFDYRDPETKELVRFFMPNTSVEDLRRSQPSRIRAAANFDITKKEIDDQLDKEIERTKSQLLDSVSKNQPQETDRLAQKIATLEARKSAKHPGIFKQLLLDMPAEALAFNIALGLSARMQAANDPAAIRHYIEQNITDPIAYVSFMGFMGGNRAVASMVNLVALDPYNHKLGILATQIEKSFRLPRAQALAKAKDYLPEPKINKSLKHLMGPLGMMVGMAVSSSVHELLADKDLRTCSASLIGKKVDPKVSAEACDRFYENWVITKKISDWAPDLVSMVSTFLIQTYIINKAAGKAWSRFGGVAAKQVTLGAQKFVPVIWKSVQFAWEAGSVLGPGRLLRFGVSVGNIVVFTAIQELILPIVRPPMEQWRQGRDITASIIELDSEIDRTVKNNWVWSEKPKAPVCDNPSAELDPLMAAFVPTMPPNCENSLPLNKLLAQYAEKNKKWRDFILQDTSMAHSNWQDYLIGFQNTYRTSYNVYADILGRVLLRQSGIDKKEGIINRLYMSEPLKSVSGVLVDTYLSPSQLAAIESGKISPQELGRLSLAEKKRRIERAVIFLKNKLQDLEMKNAKMIPEREPIAAIINGMDIYRNGKLHPALKEKLETVAGEEYKNLSPEAKVAFEDDTVGPSLNRAFQMVDSILKKDPLYRVPGLDVKSLSLDDPFYGQLAMKNPFLMVRMLLGNPEPLPPGVAFLRELDNNPRKIDQDLKDKHPRSIGRIRTSTMTDYLLASMVCGPKPDPTMDIKTREIRATEAPGILTQVRSVFGFTKKDRTYSDSRIEQEMIEMSWQRELEGKGQKRNAIVSEDKGFSAHFTPPRVVDDKFAHLCHVQPDNFPKGIERDRLQFGPHEGVWKIDGREYNGFLDIVKQHARTEILKTDDGKFAFDAWWEKNVDPAVINANQEFKRIFQKIIHEKFVPVLTKGEIETYHNRPFALGVAESIKSEIDFYGNIMGRALSLDPMAKLESESLTTILGHLNLIVKDMTNLMGSEETIEATTIKIEAWLKQKSKESPEAIAVKHGRRTYANMVYMIPPGQAKIASDRRVRFIFDFLKARAIELIDALESAAERSITSSLKSTSKEFSDLTSQMESLEPDPKKAQNETLGDLDELFQDETDREPQSQPEGLKSNKKESKALAFIEKNMVFKTRFEVLEITLANLRQLTLELDSYNSMLTSIGLQGLE